jgi:hypothetical protein
LSTCRHDRPAAGLAASAPLAGQGSAAVTAGTDGPRAWEYIALGDSCNAGPLIPLPDVTGRGCVRSTNNYPKLLNKKLDFASIEDVTCSAAETTDLRQPQTTQLGDSVPPQFDALTPTADLVTVGIGGNDYGLFGSMLETCPKAAEERPDAKAPCKATRRSGGTQPARLPAQLPRARRKFQVLDVDGHAPPPELAG